MANQIARRNGTTGLAAAVLVVAIAVGGCSTKKQPPESFDALSFYQKLTSITAPYDPTLGQTTEFPLNALACAPYLLEESNPTSYYGLKTKTGEDGYDKYQPGSHYDRDVRILTSTAGAMMSLFSESGFLKLISGQGLRPALMFDIDNTLEFTSLADDDHKGSGPAIDAMVDFTARHCFHNDIDCYFVTARYCVHESATATSKWLRETFHVGEAALRDSVYLTGNLAGCASAVEAKVAYKDAVRFALSRQQKAYWLMSFGDQLTDVIGEHSGQKMWLPNLLFRAEIVPNQAEYAQVGTKGSCRLRSVVAPDKACLDKIVGLEPEVPKILQTASLAHCLSCLDRNGCR